MDPIWADLHEVDVAVFLYLTFFKTLSYEPGAYRCGQTGCQQVLGIPLSHLLTIWITAVCYHVYLFYVDFEELNSRLHAGRTVARATRLLILFCVFIKHLAVYLTNGKYIFRAMHRLSWSYCYFFLSWLRPESEESESWLSPAIFIFLLSLVIRDIRKILTKLWWWSLLISMAQRTW